MTGIIKTGTLSYLADAHWGFAKQIHSFSDPNLSEIISAALAGDGVKSGSEASAGHHGGAADFIKGQISVEIFTQEGQ